MKSLDAELKETQKTHDETKEEVKNLKALLQSATWYAAACTPHYSLSTMTM